MSLNRYAKKKDLTQDAIVQAIRKAGWHVEIMDKPADLLCWKDGTFKVLETKSRRKKDGTIALDKRQTAQNKFCSLCKVPYVTTPEEALNALRSKSQKLWDAGYRPRERINILHEQLNGED